MRTFFWSFIIMKNSIDFCFVRFYVSFSLYTSSLSNSYLTTWLTLSQISLYIHQRDMYLISSKFLQYVLIFGKIIHAGIIFSESSLYPIRCLKLLFYQKWIKIGFLCWWNLCFSTPVSPSVIISLKNYFFIFL